MEKQNVIYIPKYSGISLILKNKVQHIKNKTKTWTQVDKMSLSDKYDSIYTEYLQ